MSATPRTARGEATKRRLLEAAEDVFAEHGYAQASVTRITDRAQVGQGTFYLYFESKLDLFVQLVDDLNRRVRQAMSAGALRGTNRVESEREGFREFFRFTAEHPALYRVVREAEFVAPEAMRRHYTRIVDGYVEGLDAAIDSGEIEPIDTTVTAWALMGIGEMIGMRWILWDGADGDVPESVLDAMIDFIRRGLGDGSGPGRAASVAASEGGAS